MVCTSLLRGPEFPTPSELRGLGEALRFLWRLRIFTGLAAGAERLRWVLEGFWGWNSSCPLGG